MGDGHVILLILVADAMSTDFETVESDRPVDALARWFHTSHVRSAEVVDGEGRLVGVVTEYDVETALMSGDVSGLTAGDIMTGDPITCAPDQPLRSVLEDLRSRDVGHIPVVRRDDPTRVVGVLRRKEILWAYGQLATEHRKLMLAAELDLSADHADPVLVELSVLPSYRTLAFRKIRDIPVPDQVLIVVLRRAGRAVVPRGNTVVEPGDVLVLLSTRQRESRLLCWVSGITGNGG